MGLTGFEIAKLIAEIGMDAVEFLVSIGHDPVTPEQWQALKQKKKARDLYREATGQEAPVSAP